MVVQKSNYAVEQAEARSKERAGVGAHMPRQADFLLGPASSADQAETIEFPQIRQRRRAPAPPAKF